MKKVYLLLFWSLLFSGTKASDTLTNSQIYNFNVGDTFDYQYSITNTDDGYSYTYYARKVLMQKAYSSGLDTIYFGFGSPGLSVTEWDTITNLDSFAIFQISNVDTTCNLLYTVDTTTYPGYISNSLDIGCFESGSGYRFTKGLGRTEYYYGDAGNSGTGCDCYVEELIYYSNGSTSVGTPYYFEDGSNLIKYIPLPEECAIWTRTVTGTKCQPDTSSVVGTIVEQIRTGNKIYKNGKNYVALICRIQNDLTGQFTSDSLIGYFYNDTVDRAAYFVQDTNSLDSILICSFNMLIGDPCSTYGTVRIDSVLIGGEYRTQWYCSESGPGGCFANIISGIGPLDGLIPINLLCGGPYDPYPSCGTLTCFSVCGQTLYPNDSAASCPLLSGIDDVNFYNQFSFTLSPNPCTQSVNVSIDENMFASNELLTINDITGRKLKEAKIKSPNSRIEVQNFAAGIYIVTLSDGKESAVRKLIVGK